MNIFIKVSFYTTKKDGSTGPTALESDGPYFEIMGQWPGLTINLKAWKCVCFLYFQYSERISELEKEAKELRDEVCYLNSHPANILFPDNDFCSILCLQHLFRCNPE